MLLSRTLCRGPNKTPIKVFKSYGDKALSIALSLLLFNSKGDNFDVKQL